MVPLDHPFQDLAGVFDEVEAICNLDRCGSPLANPVSVGSCPIAAHDRDARTSSEPLGERSSPTIGQDVNGSMSLQMDQDCAPASFPAPPPIVGAEHPRS